MATESRRKPIGIHIYSMEEIQQLRAMFERDVLRPSWALGIFHTYRSFSEVVRRVQAGHPEVVNRGKKKAALLIDSTCLLLLMIEERVSNEQASIGGLVHGFELMMAESIGYMQSLQDQQSRLVRNGAKGRKKFGDKTRSKVRDAAAQLRGRMPRDKAAPEIAQSVGLSEDRVKRLLSELFPGDAWVADTSVRSTDAT